MVEITLAAQARLQRRRLLWRALKTWVPRLRFLLYAVGVGWLFILPSDQYNKHTYISENALLPGQVNTHYSWPQVHEANVYRENIKSFSNSSFERFAYVEAELRKAGLKTGKQNFTVETSGKVISGVNVFGIITAPRGDGTEALVLSAPWVSKDGLTVNINGVAAVLSIGSFFQKHTYWSKDIIILITDGGEIGVQAWLESYHDYHRSDIVACPLLLRSGVIQAAVNLDLPGTNDYRALGIFYEGVNGQLPNLDLINTIVRITRVSFHIPIMLHDSGHIYWVNDYGDYYSSLYNLALTMKYQALGHSTGSHGLFLRYKIDAVTLYGKTLEGTYQPFMFLEIGTVVESTFRSLNNLLEHLHQSFFFYLLPSPETYISIGSYLPPAILLAVGLILHISFLNLLTLWGYTGDEPINTISLSNQPPTSEKVINSQGISIPTPFNIRPRRILFPLVALITTHAAGIFIFFLVKYHFLFKKIANFFFIQDYLFVLALSGYITLKVSSVLVSTMENRNRLNDLLELKSPHETTNSTNEPNLKPAADWVVIKCFTLALTGMIIACLSVLNFSLAVSTALIVIIPFSLFRPHEKNIIRYLQLVSLALISPPGILFLSGTDLGEFLKSALTEYQLLGNYLLPFTFCLYWPNVLAYIVIVQAPLK
ncbi:hypothetical protein G9A89_020065 [Geosiphon pyriformis]|nr:hypothetical protein G9A89_020065 [Geosiphon pyriformis]